MSLSLSSLSFDNGKESFVYLNSNSNIVKELGLMAETRVEVIDSKNNNKRIAGELVLIDNDNNNNSILKENEIALSKASFKKLNCKSGDKVELKKVPQITSFDAVINKLRGIPFKKEEINNIIQDIAKEYYSPAHIASFCSACEGDNLSIDEIAYMTEAMANAGEVLKWPYDIVVDKHCLGGIPANRTTNVAIPIVAAYGLHIPKTSSRAITSPSGTADTMEVLTNIEFSTDKLQDIVDKTNGCMILGGGMLLSPTDGTIINYRKLLNTDSTGQMVSSVLSKKLAAGSTDILIVAPVGKTAKIKDMNQFNKLKNIYESVGKKIGMNVVAEFEDGSQPIGNGIGPALEAKDIMKLFKNEPDAPQDLREVSLHLAGKIIEFDKKNVKEGEGYNIAKEILDSGKAYKKFMEIIEAQGGLKQIPEAEFKHNITSNKDGEITSIDNKKISQICRILGCPEKKASGIFLHKHLKDKVKKGDILFTLHSTSKGELNDAIKYIEENEVVGVE